MALFSKAPDYPRLVCVETTNRCNALCTFCPNNALSRDKGAMSNELFEKIIEDCREFPLETIEPFMQGDPFSDPEIIPRLEHIRRRLPRTKLTLYTNGYGLTPKKIDQMLGLRIDHLYVSINTLDEQRYKSVMGLKLPTLLRNLRYLIQPSIRHRVARRITYRMTRLGDTSLEEQDRFLEFCREHQTRPFIVGLFNYKGAINSTLPVPVYGCEHVSRLDILASGKVTLCCMDHNGEYSLGDVNQASVLEVYRGIKARRYREMHASGRRREIEPCGTCNVFWPDLRETTTAQTVVTALQFGAYYAKHRPAGKRPPASES